MKSGKVSGNSAKYAAYAYSKGYTTGTTAIKAINTKNAIKYVN